jgi:hypothetical protein
MRTDRDTYRQTVVDLYLRLPETPRRLSRFDLRLVRQLGERQIPLPVIETAFLLATVRRAARRPDALPLGPIRSLHYFMPVIDELLAHPVPESYLIYLRSKVALRPTARNAPSTHGPLALVNRHLFKFLRF